MGGISAWKRWPTLILLEITQAPYTVPSESIQATWPFPHFVPLKPYSQIGTNPQESTHITP